MKTNKTCTEFSQHFPELLYEPDEHLWREWEAHRQNCPRCDEAYCKVAQEQQVAQNLVDQLMHFLPPFPRIQKIKRIRMWPKYATAAIILLLLSLNFYLIKMQKIPSLHDKITALVSVYDPTENSLGQAQMIEGLIAYGSNFSEEYLKLESLAESYEKKLNDRFVPLAKMRLVLNCRVYVSTLEEQTLMKLAETNDIQQIRETFSRAIYNISVDENSESLITMFFHQAIPHLLTLHQHRRELLHQWERQNAIKLWSEEKIRFIIWKTEQYFIKNIF